MAQQRLLQISSFRHGRTIQRVVALILALVLCSAVVAAVAMPGPTSCAVIDTLKFETLPSGARVEPGASEAERQRLADIERAARLRIADTFGAARANPIIAFLRSPRALYPFVYNAFGSTQFVGGRICVLIGPEGTNTDVVAHELMHAELADQVGAWQRWRSIPVWFDEGVAMQLDHRPAYDLGTDAAAVAPQMVRDLKSPSQFFVSDSKTLTLHYALAKAEVSLWLAKLGRGELYDRLQRLRAGAAFDEVVAR
jgi:hypothetical protein